MTPEEEVLERIRKMLAKLEAEGRAARELKYSAATIVRFRLLKANGEFARTIVSRVPVLPEWDEITLSPCGHSTRLLATMPLNARYTEGVGHDCRDCEQAWLREHTEGTV
jgi:hypothetical protein